MLASAFKNQCSAAAPVEGTLRFDGGSTDAGRVQVFLHGAWGSVCTQPQEARTVAAVACRQLGFGSATGTMRMPASADGPMWLTSLQCRGNETKLTQCLGADGKCQDALGIRCLACTGDACAVYTAPVTFSGALTGAGEVVPSFYAASAAPVQIEHALRLECARRLGPRSRVSPVNCDVKRYKTGSPSAQDDAPTTSNATANTAATAATAVDDDDDDDALLEGLPDPFRPEIAKRAYVYAPELVAEYSQRRAALKAFVRRQPDRADSLRALVRSGALQWNDAGILRRPLLAALNTSSPELGLIRQLYVCPRVQIVSDIDAAVGDPRRVSALPDGSSARAIADALRRDGLAEIDDYGLNISALSAVIDEAFAQPDPEITSVASNGASAATRVHLPALAPLLTNSTIIEAVRAYLGPDAALDGYKAVRLAPSASGVQNIAGLWHNDRAGHRLKLFIRLHDVDPRPEAGWHPTLVAAGSHEVLHYSFESYEHSRMLDEFVRSEYTVASLGGPRGSGFVFDTNSLHRGVPEGLFARTVVVLEYHSAAKCPVIQTLDLPIPCPSGDQRLLSEQESQLTTAIQPTGSFYGAVSHSAAAAKTETATMVPGAGRQDQCFSWTNPDSSKAVPAEIMPGHVLVQTAHAQLRLAPLSSWASVGHALSARPGCTAQWRFYSFDVMPMDGNTVWLNTTSGREGICLLDDILGRVPFTGAHAGGCLVPGVPDAVFGGFHMLLTFPTPAALDASGEPSSTSSSATSVASVAPEVARLRALVLKHVSGDDGAMLEAITQVGVPDLLESVTRAATEPVATKQGVTLIEAVLSAERFVPHSLNAAGLHLLRVLLAERMDDARRHLAANHSAEAEALRPTWERDGVLLLDFAQYTSSRGTGNEKLNEVLRMAAASSLPAHTLHFVTRAVQHVPADPQYALHMDTFHSVVKIWVYPKNMTVSEGPLHVVRGSHRCSSAKLRWLYERTRSNAADVITEPSLRFDAQSSSGAQAAAALKATGLAPATPILPLPNTEQTIVIADTSALHCRGQALPHTSRTALRPMGAENDGGVRRLNPFRSIEA